ncbi:MAG: DNA repair protein RecN [Lactovum sp.]
MLKELSVKNFAIIDEISLSFNQGMTILTGETGAGKSIIIEAMNILLGERASSSFVRHREEKAEIEALFLLNKSNSKLNEKLEELGIPVEPELIMKREIFAEGGSRCRINGQLVNLTSLRAISSFLIDIHGQHDNQELMNSSHHLEMLDEFGDEHFQKVKKNYQLLFSDFRKIREELTKKKENAKNVADKIDRLEEQIEEIEKADIDLEKDGNLFVKRDKLTNVKEIAESLNIAYQLLDDEESSALSLVKTAMLKLEQVSEFDKSYQKLEEKISEAYYLLEEVSTQLDGNLSDLEFRPEELLEIEERIYLLTSLKRKYGPEISDILNFLEQGQLELFDLQENDTNIEELEVQMKKKQAELVECASQLNEARHELALDLEKDIQNELKELYMEKANFKVQFESSKFSFRGNESVEFYIQTNPGELFKPLAKTASGGELSRLMLAIKSSFARHENKTSIVFDEVDTGVSGRVAQAIAQKIYKIAKSGQVLAISHLPQVVAIADEQFYIEKSSDEKVTKSTARKLKGNERVEEVAKMLAGDNMTAEALAQAKKLLIQER